MTGDYSWYSSAGKYLALYEDVTKPATQFSLTEEQPKTLRPPRLCKQKPGI